jgi:hypothetical protein
MAGEQEERKQPAGAGAPPGGKDEKRDVVEEEDEDNGRTSPFGWVSILIIALLVVGTWFLIQRLSADSTMQDCIQSGRRNCAPIDNTAP